MFGRNNKAPAITLSTINRTFDMRTLNALKVMGAPKSEEKKAKRKFDERKYKDVVFYLSFKGDTAASQLKYFREEVTQVILVAPLLSEVVISLHSAGGTVIGYGAASEQIKRLKAAGLSVTVIIDQIAASGGYMMACVADKIIAAPTAMIGSIGVVAEFANYSKLMENHGVEWHSYTAGLSKRSVSPFKEKTADDVERFQEDLEDIHKLFKDHVTYHRPQIDADVFCDGSHWPATVAKENGFVDELGVVDDYLLKLHNEKFQIVAVTHTVDEKKSFKATVAAAIAAPFVKLIEQKLNSSDIENIFFK